jgi:hypothetical protein
LAKSWHSGGTLSKFKVFEETEVENLETFKLAQKVTDPCIFHTFAKAAALTRLMLGFEGPEGGVRVGARVDSRMVGGSGSVWSWQSFHQSRCRYRTHCSCTERDTAQCPINIRIVFAEPVDSQYNRTRGVKQSDKKCHQSDVTRGESEFKSEFLSDWGSIRSIKKS